MPFDSRKPQMIAASYSELASASLTTSFESLPLVVRLAPALEALLQVAQEAARVRAVDEAVVVRQREVHHRADRDRVVAVLVAHDPRALDDRVRAEDAGLRLADHGRAVERAVAAGVRDRV